MPVKLVKSALKEFLDDECPSMAAALSYYTIFSLPPLLILILLIVGIFLDQETVRTTLTTQLGELMGESAGNEVRTIFEQANRPDVNRGVASVLGILALLFGATGAVGQLQTALNRTWEVEPDPAQGGIRSFVMKRLLSFGMILGLAFLLMVSLALSAAISAFGGVLGGVLPGLGEPFLHLINFVVSSAVFVLLFAALFKVMPDAEVAWRDVWVGAAVTTLLFVLGKFLIGFYLGRSNPGEAYGAAGSLAVMLIWVYYSSMIVLFGAEFTQAWAEQRGGGIRPEEGAVRVVETKQHVR